MNRRNNDVPDLKACVKIAVSAVKDAASFLDSESDQSVLEHLKRDVKIRADYKLNELICSKLEKKTSYAIMSEESEAVTLGRKFSGLHWIVDPLDGSLNFSRGIPLYCISVALWDGATPLIGIVYDFYRDELFVGAKNEGAWLNGKTISVAKTGDRKKAILCTGFPSKTDFTETALLKFVQPVIEYKKVRLLGSAALSLAYVASGRADVYEEKDIAIWDVAAGIAIVNAAGGAVRIKESKIANRLWVRAANDLLL